MKVVQVPVAKLKKYEKNPRVINREVIDAVKKSIAAHGFNQPIVVDKNYVICVGHARYEAACEMGLKKIPCYVKEFKSPEHFASYNIADNKVGELARWDEELLRDVLKRIEDGDEPALELSGFSDSELTSLLYKDDVDYDKAFDDDSGTEGVSDKTPSTKKIQLEFSEKNHKLFLKKIEKFQKSHKTKDMSDAVFKIVKKFVK